jgi:rhodanese-related sulfurtransferase
MAEASECAADQGKFWEAVDKIYSRQTDTSDDGLMRDAAEIGLDQAKFKQCLDSGAEAARVKRDHDDGKALGVNATPTFFFGRHAIADVPNFDDFSRLIEEQLAVEGAGSSSSPTTPASPTSSAQSRTPGSENTPHPGAGEATPSYGLFGSAQGGALSSFQGGGVTCSEAEAAKKQPELISTSQLRALLKKTRPLFVDVRPAKEYAAGQIPGAMNIPVDNMPQRWSSLPKDRLIVFYESGQSAGDVCASGRTAGRILLEHGYSYDHVKVYQDGLAGWQKAGL